MESMNVKLRQKVKSTACREAALKTLIGSSWLRDFPLTVKCKIYFTNFIPYFKKGRKLNNYFAYDSYNFGIKKKSQKILKIIDTVEGDVDL